MNFTTEDPPTMGDDNSTAQSIPFLQPILSWAELDVLLLVNYILFTFPLSILGVLTNVANMIVYFKMGFSETSNVNFFTLSTFDLLFSMISLMGRVFYGPIFRGMSFYPVLKYIVIALARTMYVVICGSAMMTVLISTERCLSVVFPLKVKTLLSQRRRLYMLLAVLAYHVIFLIILYADPGPPYNVYSPKEAFYYFYLYAIPLNICFFAIILNTIFLVIRLRISQKWRKQTASQSSQNNDKETKLSRTIIAISTLFIVCYSPTVGFFIAQTIFPAFNFDNPYYSTFSILVQEYNSTTQMISASVNIFFYYRMSSRYKKVFSSCFMQWKTEDRGNLKPVPAA